MNTTEETIFPIDTSAYSPLTLDPAKPLSHDDLAVLKNNIQVVRDTIVFFSAVAGAKGLGGHTGGAYSIVPEVLIADSFMRGSDRVYQGYFDEAGHRVAIQYAMSAFNGIIPMDLLLRYREAGYGLYGHPEVAPELGVTFASGRLGHLWSYVNGVARGNPDRAVFLFGSDGSQQEGNDAEAARFAVAQNLNVKLVIDDNNVTIAGKPDDYLPGFDLAKTLAGHGLKALPGDGEDVPRLYERMREALNTDGPVAVVNKRLMAPGVPGIEGSSKGHDVIAKDFALDYLRARGLEDAAAYLETLEPVKHARTYRGSTKEVASNRSEFGKIINGILDRLPESERDRKLVVIDSDLEGSTGLKAIRETHPNVYIRGGVMERNNLSAAAGFSHESDRQGIFSTFSAFLEMVISEATMARMNAANLLCHFSHAGVDEIADNTCHFGINVFFAHSGIPEGDKTRLYFPADAAQFKAVLETIFEHEGLRYLFSTRSKVPYILKADGSRYYGDNYTFEPGRDDVIREGSAGYVVSYGEMLYRALDAVEQAREQGIDVGLINKTTLNVVDEDALARVGKTGFAIIVEGQNANTGLGTRYGSWLLHRGFTPQYHAMAVTKVGAGGIQDHIPYQELAPENILDKIRLLAG